MTALPGPACPEAEYRASLPDDDFWDYVLLRQRPGDQPDDEPDLDGVTSQFDPCLECGERGPCAYDNLGRALIHVITSGEER